MKNKELENKILGDNLYYFIVFNQDKNIIYNNKNKLDYAIKKYLNFYSNQKIIRS